ncbi:phage DNA packaging protein J [Streptomyces pseudovenezuelae]|uniref:phage DNA packaging protein J n=1 Tax=Streptomyces pseudovenezuelae TaxID=67350 RepID=UPI0036EEAB8C
MRSARARARPITRRSSSTWTCRSSVRIPGRPLPLRGTKGASSGQGDIAARQGAPREADRKPWPARLWCMRPGE